MSQLDVIPNTYWKILRIMAIGILVGFFVQIWKTLQSIAKLTKTVWTLIILSLILLTFPLSIPTISLVIFIFKLGSIFQKSGPTPGVKRMRRSGDAMENAP